MTLCALEECRRPFTPRRRDQRACSPVCARALKRRERRAFHAARRLEADQ